MTKGVSKLRKPGEIDRQVGATVRARRIALGISQEQLARMLGLTFQQVQKYERGTNRISVGRLLQLAKLLRTSVNALLSVGAEHVEHADGAGDRQILELTRVARSLTPKHMRSLHRVAVALAEATGGGA